MAKKRVAVVGFNFPSTEASKISLESKDSLLDYDVVIIDPSIHNFYGYRYEDYQGKPCLDDTNSFKLKESLEHWRREILEFVKSGKNVFILLNEKEEVFVATGQTSHSGTGRNRQTTRHVSITSNYELIPGKVSITNSKGSSMLLVDQNNELAPYWAEIGSLSEYRVLLEGQGIKALVQTKTGKKVLGALIKYKNAEGGLFLMPYIDLSCESYTYENKNDKEYYWTKEAFKIGTQILNAICALDKAVMSSGDLSAIPDWVSQDKFILPKEGKVRAKLITVESKLETLQKEKEELEQEISDESALKRLIFENGKVLESAVHVALELLGFSVSHYKDNESEFDVIFECKEGRLLGEVEGKDNKAISIDKLRQLEMNIHEDFSRDEIEFIAKGVLIGNAYRLKEPSERDEFFTEKCLTAANRSNTALIRTDDLFYIAQYLTAKSDKKYATACRKSIIKTSGLVSFPKLPNMSTKNKTIANDGLA